MKYLKIHTLEKGWCDRDEIMLHAVFQILVDFMEQEKPDEIVAWNSDETHQRVWKEIRSLYGWWKNRRPVRKNPLDDKRLKVPPMKFEDVPGTDYKRMIKPDRKKYAAYYKAQIVTSKGDVMGLRKMPRAFTEQRVSMLSSVLRRNAPS